MEKESPCGVVGNMLNYDIFVNKLEFQFLNNPQKLIGHLTITTRKKKWNRLNEQFKSWINLFVFLFKLILLEKAINPFALTPAMGK